MSAAQHTPGPWGTGQAGTANHPQRSVIGLGPRCIGVAYGMNQEEADANARMFAASIEMRRTLQLLLGSLEFEQHMHGKKDPKRSTIDFPRAIEMCRAAIAKAGDSDA